jgi:hypothetical protein
MIVQSIATVNDITNNQYRSTIYKTLVDMQTNRQYIEAVQYLYTKVGELEPTHHNTTVDKKA